MAKLAAFALAILAAGCSASSHGQAADTSTGAAVDQSAYPYSDVYRRVDLSFSNILIDTPFGTVRHRLREIRVHNCERYEECSWADSDKVEHFFWPSDEDEGNRLLDGAVVKVVRAADFGGRSIGALGIGLARDKDEVLARVRAFLPEVEIDCGRVASGNVGPDECGGTVDPGWFQIGFDTDGKLEAVRFDAYHFT